MCIYIHVCIRAYMCIYVRISISIYMYMITQNLNTIQISHIITTFFCTLLCCTVQKVTAYSLFATVRKVLQDLKCIFTEHLNLLMDLLHWVLTENYCIFDKTIYHQIKGTAMGTPTAVS